MLQVGEVAQFGRYLADQLVATEGQIIKFGEVAQFSRYLAAQPVEGKIQLGDTAVAVGGDTVPILRGAYRSASYCCWSSSARP